MNEHYRKFIDLRQKLGVPDKVLASELGISPRAMTERVTGRATIKRETILALEHLLNEQERMGEQ